MDGPRRRLKRQPRKDSTNAHRDGDIQGVTGSKWACRLMLRSNGAGVPERRRAFDLNSRRSCGLFMGTDGNILSSDAFPLACHSERRIPMIQLVHTVVIALSSLPLVNESHPPTAYANEESLSVGRGFICDTEEQVKVVVTTDENKIATNLKKVNDQFGKDSCTFATALFRKAGDERDASTETGKIRVEKVQLVGYIVENELITVSKPTEQYFGAPETVT
jgi:hypothetical protein